MSPADTRLHVSEAGEGTSLVKGKPGAAPREEPSLCRMIQMTVCTSPISLIWATMGMVVLPAEALRLYPDNEALMLGTMMTVVAVSQLICPVVGRLSDSCRSAWGKRRPYILAGTVLTIVNVIGLWYASNLMHPFMYFLCLFLSQAGLNMIYIAQAAIVPDNFKEDMGSTSGIISVWQLTGNFGGMIWIISTYQLDYHYSYGFYVLLLTLAAGVVSQIPERSSLTDPEDPLTIQKLIDSFKIDMHGDYDFFLVFVGRMFFYISMSCQTFSFYYFRDMLKIKDESLIRYQLAGLLLLGTFVGMCASYPLGTLSDNPKIGRKKLIYFACATMGTTYVGYCVIPLIWSPGHGALTAIYVMGSLYGLGIAGYTSVDYALAIDCLPESQKGSSEALGLWGIAGFVGSSVGPLLGGILIEMQPHPGGGYSYYGYASMMSMGMVSFVGCAFVTSLIKKVD